MVDEKRPPNRPVDRSVSISVFERSTSDIPETRATGIVAAQTPTTITLSKQVAASHGISYSPVNLREAPVFRVAEPDPIERRNRASSARPTTLMRPKMTTCGSTTG